MRVLNFHSKFTLGSTIEVKKIYSGGAFTLDMGARGVVEKITIESLPQMGLFDLRIVHMKFGNHQLGMEEKIAREYFEVV